MISLSVLQIAEAVRGKVHGDAAVVVSGTVETDSRLISVGSLFVAKPGEFTDGHLFAPQAISAGAVALIVERVLEGLEVPQIEVEDSVLALGSLAAFVLSD